MLSGDAGNFNDASSNSILKGNFRFRTRELQLTEELDHATALIMGLQNENEASLERERTTRHQAAAEGQIAEQQQLHISRLNAANQVLQDRLRMMENRLLEADKVKMTFNHSSARSTSQD